MTFTVETESGSVYEFTHKNGHTFIRNGSLAGEVVSINNGSISVGKIIDMDISKGNPLELCDKLLIRTTPVARISIVL